MALSDFTDLDSLKAYASIDYATDDVTLNQMIAAFSTWVRGQVNRDVTTNDYDIRRSGRRTFAMQLPQYPITAVEMLEIDGRSIPSQASWGSPGYRFDEEQIVLTGHCFTRGISNVRVQFTAGFYDPPADLALAVNELVTLRYRMRDKLEWSSKGLAGETVSLVQKAMPEWVKMTLASYQMKAPL